MFFLECLWFLLPLLMANQSPGFAAKLNLPGSHVPVSRRWLGDRKTFGAYYAAPFGAVCTLYLQRWLFPVWSMKLGLINYFRSDLWFIGLILGLGVALGDHTKSFVKRQAGVPLGAPWWPYDQLDFLVGSILLGTPFIGWIGWDRVVFILAVTLFIHPIGNRLGYWLRLREVPW